MTDFDESSLPSITQDLKIHYFFTIPVMISDV